MNDMIPENKITQYGDFEQAYTTLENAQIVILPIPYDKTSTWIKGADKGPQAILEASYNMEFYDIETQTEVYKRGIYTAPPVTENASPEQMVTAVKTATTQYLEQGKFVVPIGGEHSVSIGAIQAFAQKFDNLTVLQIDAHTDLRPTYLGSANNHACVMARAREVANIVQVGIRSMDSSELPYVEAHRIFYAHDIVRSRGKSAQWQYEVVDQLTDNVYVTIDLDGFDPSVVPSTGTPEPGGLWYYEVLDLLKKVNENANIVGFDVVELCPNPHSKASDFLAAKLIYQLLSYKFH
ncbi:agmatinase [Microscilla marina]|uniref:Agmatinase, putative n=1 Tax=Microscilla marina ATCC 23134 TaxID=313606 RepID=A1ZV42_MICM2|nr:agmatinase [Microscilla marina]EAY25698.1 agmatinase, putative [Microscilla marina ATCC 23134]